jgi:hypothetical protein
MVTDEIAGIEGGAPNIVTVAAQVGRSHRAA